MRLLILTQAVDTDNPVLGFFHAWIEALAKDFESIEVICLYEGQHVLPANVRVHSLGKERGAQSPLIYAARFLRLSWCLRRNYDAVLVHMNEEYVLLAGWLWRLLGKRSVLWRNHKEGSWHTRLAAQLVDTVCHTSSAAHVARFPNARTMPIGIDMTRFRPDAGRSPNSILFLGRLDPIKRPEVFLEAMRQIAKTNPAVHANVYGDPSPGREAYADSMRHTYKNLPNVTFHPGVANNETPSIYRGHTIYVNLTASGSFDKTIGEAMASGCVVVAANEAVAEALGPFAVPEGDTERVVKALDRALALAPKEAEVVGMRNRAYMERGHSLTLLIERLRPILKGEAGQ
ncbi:MAG TPA: glycosyltransferase family 4 protein [Candidatus Paceibacterota bacterium]|jgi:glycosyltransferase involved in cell wall biosynthesis